MLLTVLQILNAFVLRKKILVLFFSHLTVSYKMSILFDGEYLRFYVASSVYKIGF